MKSPGQICIQTKNTNSVESKKEKATKNAVVDNSKDKKASFLAKERQKVQSALYIREKNNNNSSVDLSAGMRYF